MSEWRKVVFGHEIGPDGRCPACGDADYTECPCPGPTMEGWLYQWREGVLWAREEELDEVMEDIEEQLGKLVYAGVAMDLDLALIEGEAGQPVLHAANCPLVQRAREQDKQVFTMFGCQELPDDTVEKHTCLAQVVARNAKP